MKLSLLIPTVPRRLRRSCADLLECLLEQAAGRSDVEVLALFDNKTRTVGEKRNELMRMARGEYVAFIDDDDRIAPDYLLRIIDALERNPGVDLVLFDALLSMPGKCPRRGRFHLECKQTEHYRSCYYSPPCHVNVWRKALVFDVPFPAANFAEDRDWQERVIPLVRTHVKIEEVLYYYDWHPRTSETAHHRPVHRDGRNAPAAF